MTASISATPRPHDTNYRGKQAETKASKRDNPKQQKIRVKRKGIENLANHGNPIKNALRKRRKCTHGVTSYLSLELLPKAP